jgi:hypothetical protein
MKLLTLLGTSYSSNVIRNFRREVKIFWDLKMNIVPKDSSKLILIYRQFQTR